jgi:hypothetical protein
MIQEINKTPGFNFLKILLITFFILIFGVIVTFSILSILSPLTKIKEINNKYNNDNLENSYKDALYNQNLFRLKKDEAYLKAKLLMSENDSINLSINIPDSLISIEIKGTSIYSVPLRKIQISKMFDHIDRDALISYLSSPFCILHEKATILKEPLIIKKAPKDTIEANKNNVMPDTLGPKISAYRFYTDKDLIINIKQSENLDIINSFKYEFDYNLQISSIQLKKLIKFKIPDYIPWIKLEIDKKDAIAIYRALPEHSFISIHF